MLEMMTDLSAADWIVNDQHNNRDDWDVLVTSGPSGYENYGRLRYIPDPVTERQGYEKVVLEESHLSDYDQVRVAIDALVPFTNTPDEAYLLMWTGSGLHWANRVKDAPEVNAIAAGSGRDYYLFRVSLLDIVNLPGLELWHAWITNEFSFNTPPAFLWPADRAWCFTSDVDPYWAGIGGSQAAIDALLADVRIDVVPMIPDELQPEYSWPNRPNRLVSMKRPVDGSRRIGSR